MNQGEFNDMLRAAVASGVIVVGTGDFKADGSVPMTGILDLGGHQITEMADAAGVSDGISQEYGDARYAPISAGGRSYYARAAAAGSIVGSVAAAATRFFNVFGAGGNSATENLISSVANKPLRTIKSVWVAIDASAGGSSIGTITLTLMAAGVATTVARVLAGVTAAGLTWYQVTANLPYTIASDVTTLSLAVLNGQDGAISVYAVAVTD